MLRQTEIHIAVPLVSELSVFGDESLHQGSHDNGVRIINFATSENLVVKSRMFTHRNIPNYTWTSPERRLTTRLITY